MKALFDTNILIDFLNGLPQARREFAHYDENCISIITWMEVMVGADPKVVEGTEAFLKSFHIVPIDADIAQTAVRLRRSNRIKLPDAIIWATAQTRAMLLVTRNTKDFPPNNPGIRLPYRL